MSNDEELIVHIGYPKTATTSIQHGWFYPAHGAGLINYFGKIKYPDGSVPDGQYIRLHQDVIQSGGDPNELLTLSDGVNLISHERLTVPPECLADAVGYSPESSPYACPSALANSIDGLADECSIVVTIRNQKNLINSVYAHYYHRLRRNDRFDRWDNYLDYVIETEPNVFEYDRLLARYAEHFGEDNIDVLFFEDFVRDKATFAKNLATLLSVDPDNFLDAIELETHANSKTKTEEKYIKKDIRSKQSHEFVTGVSPLNKSKDAFKRLIGESRFDRLVEKFYFVYYDVPRPDDGQLERIADAFRGSNAALAGRYGVTEETLKRYEYI